MKIIVAVDEKNGMLFNKRRQSQDVKLREYILQRTKDGRLRMNAYSAKQFAAHQASHIMVDDCFLANANADDYCFVENEKVEHYNDKISTIILCKWNRDYPSDTKLDIDVTRGWRCVAVEEIAGKSHEKITIEEWVK